jgi:hypothetical protein
MPGLLLRLEGVAVFVAAIAVYLNADFSVLALVALFLVPDLSMLAYLASPRIGAAAYNVVHTEVWPLALATAGVLADEGVLVQVGLIWLAHIGIDRALGYGLKYPSEFKDTHLQRT